MASFFGSKSFETRSNLGSLYGSVEVLTRLKEEDLAPPDKTSNVEGNPLSPVQTSWMAFYALAGCLCRKLNLGCGV